MPLGPSSSASVLTSPWMPGRKTLEKPRRGQRGLDRRGRDRDDATLLRGLEMRQGGASAARDRQEHRLEGPLPGLVVEREQRTRGRPARVRDEDVEAAERGRGGLDQQGRAVRRAEVDALAGDLGALARDRLGLVHRRGELGVVAPAHHHVHALARERAGDCLADAVAGGHHGRAAANEIEIHAGTLHARRPRGSVRGMSTALSTLAEYARANPRSRGRVRARARDCSRAG